MVIDISTLRVSTVEAMSHRELAYVSLNNITHFFKIHHNSHIGIIYCYTSTQTGHKYIGQTTDPYHRDYAHRCAMKKESKRSDANSRIANAFRRYGFHNFKYNVLKLCLSEDIASLRSILDKQEEYYIHLYDTTNPQKGFNINSGGLSCMTGGKNYGARAVSQYSLTGGYIRNYDSVSEASRANNISSNGIKQACRHVKGTVRSNGFIWTFADEEFDSGSLKIITRGVVHRYNLSGEYIDSFYKYSEAAKAVNGDDSRIQRHALGNSEYTAYGYRWSKKKMDRLPGKVRKHEVEVHSYDKDGHYVASFHTLQEGARYVNRKATAQLIACLRQPWRMSAGLYWRTFMTDRIDLPVKRQKAYGKQ